MSRAGAHRTEVYAGIRYCLGVFVTARIAISLVALVGVAVLPDFSSVPDDRLQGLPPIPQPVDVPGWPARGVDRGWQTLVTSWERQDALWYLRIADQGYEPGDGSAAFYPLYPLAIRAVSWALGGHPLAAGLLVSNAAFLAVLILLYLLSRRELDEAQARRAVLYAAVFPAAFFFMAPYTESLFLLAVIAAFWSARSGWWEVAGLAGIAAALTRNVGVLLAVPLAIEAIHQSLSATPRRWSVRGLIAAGGPVLGGLAYLGFWERLSGDWLTPVHDQANWLREASFPLVTLARATVEAFRFIGSYPGGFHLLDWLVAVPVLVAVVYVAVRFRPSYGAYAVLMVLAPLSYAWEGRPLMSFPRFALVVFPVYWALAGWTSGRPRAHELVVIGSAVLLGIMTVLFVTWSYVF